MSLNKPAGELARAAAKH